MRWLGIALGALLSVAVVGAAAWGLVGLRPTAHDGGGSAILRVTQRGEEGDPGVHGGPIARFHRPAACGLVDVSGLPGNWTHGDYVTAVEALGDPALVPTAARSDCGKPLVAVGRGGGPPAHALENRARGRAEEGRSRAPAGPSDGS
ncbi:MAG TPA: hypothetical protein VNO17_02695 [Actinomycetota bacterium]|nr:hypothetical protein [Actinomycetota bacterium]